MKQLAGGCYLHATDCTCPAYLIALGAMDAELETQLELGEAGQQTAEQDVHGTTVQYNAGCRCRQCRDAIAAYARLRRKDLYYRLKGDVRALEAILRGCTLNEETGCWLWNGSVDSNGYPNRGRLRKRPHAAIHLLLKGFVPEGYVLDHRCHDPKTCQQGCACLHRRCVNPQHITAVLIAENSSIDRAVHKPISEEARRKSALTRKTRSHCNKGHLLSDENVRLYQGRRYCRGCARECHRKQNDITSAALKISRMGANDQLLEADLERTE